MDELASTLSKVFMKDIINENISEQQKITVIFEDRSLDYILSTIQATLDIEIIRKEDKIIIR